LTTEYRLEADRILPPGRVMGVREADRIVRETAAIAIEKVTDQI